MLARVGQKLAALFRATAPDPFVIAILLTLLTFALVLTLTDAGASVVIGYWSGDAGVWRFLSFAMQMCLILVTGHALASSPPVSRLLTALSNLPRTAPQAAALVAMVAGALGVLNWGLGLIGGALIARQVGMAMRRKGVPAHYPLLAASGYVGLLVWHGGMSGTAPLKVSTLRELTDVLGANTPVAPMGLDQTLLSPLNLIITGGLLILAPIVMALLMPKDKANIETIDRYIIEESKAPNRDDQPRKPLIPRILEDSPLVTVLLVAMIAWWAKGYYFPHNLADTGLMRLTPNAVNFTMLMLGLILHGTPGRYVAAINEATRGCAGIILQFPLYGGIMGMMAQSGLTERIAESFAGVANGSEAGLGVMTFLSAGLVNLFVPSGGGQWAIQGPIAMRAAADAGVDPARLVMAVAYGDEWTNMLQPFWALPLLGVTGVQARDIMGYTALLLVASGLWITLCLTFV